MGKVDNPQLVLRAVLGWTGGQPFLTQKLCKLVLTSSSSIPANGKAEWVEQLVRSQVLENWEANDEPEHLKTIRDRLLWSGQRTLRLLELYQQILQQQEVAVDDTPEQMELRLSGLVVKQQGSLIALLDWMLLQLGWGREWGVGSGEWGVVDANENRYKSLQPHFCVYF